MADSGKKPSIGSRRDLNLPSLSTKPKNRPRLPNLAGKPKEEEEEIEPVLKVHLNSVPIEFVRKEIQLLLASIVVINLCYATIEKAAFWIFCLCVFREIPRGAVLVWIRCGAVLWMVFAHDDAWSYKLASFASLFLIYSAERIFNATQKEIEHQTKQQQQNVDQLLKDYMERRKKSLIVAADNINDLSAMVLATLEQFAPPSILSSTYELLSACSMAVPITTISAINIVVKQAYHIGSRIQSLSDGLCQGDDYVTKETTVNESFDIGELLQNVGDALAGLSAKHNIHFIVYHMDNGLHYSHIMGDEAATKHALMHLLRSLFEGCTPGACIELGLNLTAREESRVRVTFDILLSASPAIPAGLSSIPTIPNSQFTQQLASYIGGKLTTQETESNQVRIQMSLDTFSGKIGDQPLLLIEKPSQILERQLEDVRFSNEPSLKDLTNFIASLKGVRLVLHAAEKSVFAKHLTSSLTHWNADISHVPLTASYDALVTPRVPQRGKVPSSATSEDQIHSIPPAFILIDDDVVVLENKLREFRERRPGPVRKPTKRPNENILLQGVTIGVIFFTSLSNYKRVRDTIQYFSGLAMQYPRVVVVPKPAGPRRFLTALHTAWINAVVEPHFIPIATSPQSPFVGSSPKSNESSGSSFVTPALFTPHLFSPGGKRTPEERSAHYFTPRTTITSPFKETRRHRPQIKVKTPPAPAPVQEEVVKAKPKININISNRKRKEKNVSSQTSPPITVLIVEDNIINQAILSTWMKKHGIKYSVASDGKQAVEKWRGGGFHLILMDIQLPVMDGIQATKTIRQMEKEDKIGVLPSAQSDFQSPVIIVALTASSLESDRQSALAAGCNDFLTKPVSLEWLDKKITEWGCMQALIDFEGWKKWRKNKKTDKAEEKAPERKSLPERVQTVRDISRGILLCGSSQSQATIDTIPKQLEERNKNHDSL